jgi:hypothetical protein
MTANNPNAKALTYKAHHESSKSLQACWRW